jgi:nuclear pore complex protein Nup98-Nup96
MQQYSNKSFEELRLEDYRRGNKGGSAPSAFGSSSTVGGSPFGVSAGPATGMFGGTSFGVAPSTSVGGFGGFGSTAAPATGGNIFGSTQPTLGATAGTQGFSFGGTTASPSGFNAGATATAQPSFGLGAQPAFGTQSSSFGAQSAFGTQQPQPQQQQQQPAFGSATSSFGGFGKPAPSFGSLAPTTQPTPSNISFGGFGSSPGGAAAGLGATGAGFGFGSSAATKPSFEVPSTGFGAGSAGFGGGLSTPLVASTSGFGADASKMGMTSSSGFGGFGTASTSSLGVQSGLFTQQMGMQGMPMAPVMQPSGAVATLGIDQKIELLMKKKDELNEAPATPLKAEEEAPRAFAGFGMGKSPAGTLRGTPMSSTRLLPRGIKLKHAADKSSSMINTLHSMLGNQSSTSYDLRSPAASATFSGIKGAKMLVIPPLFSPSQHIEDLPPPPMHTPHRDESWDRASKEDGKYQTSEATGLTPVVGTTPTLSRNRASAAMSTFDGIPPHSASKDACLQSPIDRDDDMFYPKLERAGYFTSPDISILQKMSRSELSQVRNFTVFRPNIGKIEWEGNTDIRGLDLDQIVKIERKEVFVYEYIDAPDQGKGLNKPATITFYNVLPNPPISEEKRQQYVIRLRDFCERNDAAFLSYDAETGQWSFAVKHFSRYGLDDDDNDNAVGAQPYEEPKKSSDKMQIVATSTPNGAFATAAVQVSGFKRLKTILLRPELVPGPDISAEAITARQKQDSEAECSTMSIFSPISRDRKPFSSSQSLEWSGLDGVEYSHVGDVSHYSAMDTPFAYADTASTVPPSRTSVWTPSFFLPKESAVIAALLEVKSKLASDRGMNADAPLSFSKVVFSRPVAKEGMKDPFVNMGRSFRVGWSRDGRIVHPGKLFCAPRDDSFASCHRIAVEKVNSCGWARSHWPDHGSLSKLDQVMRSIRHHAEIVQGSKQSLCGHWSLPCARSASTEMYLRYVSMLKAMAQSVEDPAFSHDHPDKTLHQVLLLVDAVEGQETCEPKNPVDLMPGIGDRASPEQSERRRNALSTWFEQATAHEGSPFPSLLQSLCADVARSLSVAPEEEESLEHLFELLSVHRIAEAVEYAEQCGWFRLASIVSQVGSDASTPGLIRCQLEQWHAMDALNTIPEGVQRIYSVVASNDLLPGSSKATLTGLGWLRALSMVFWYFVDESTLLPLSPSRSLAYFASLVDKQFADPPLSAYVNQASRFGANVAYPGAAHGLYRLLKVLLSASAGAVAEEAIVDALRCEGFTRDELDCRASYTVLVCLEGLQLLCADSFPSRLIRQQFISQLLSEQQYEWAIFVAMQLSEEHDRRILVDAVLLQWVASLNCGAEQRHSTIADALQRLGLSEMKLHEASACWYGYNGLHQRQAWHLQMIGRNLDAAEVVCLHISPRNGEQLELLESLLEGEESSPGTGNALSMLVLEYLQLQDATKHAQEERSFEQGVLIDELMAVAKALIQKLFKHYELVKGRKDLTEEFRAMLVNMTSYLFKLVARAKVADNQLDGPFLLSVIATAKEAQLPVYQHEQLYALRDCTAAFMNFAADTITL